MPAFQLGDPDSIPGKVRDFKLYPRTLDWVSSFGVLACIVYDGGLTSAGDRLREIRTCVPVEFSGP